MSAQGPNDNSNDLPLVPEDKKKQASSLKLAPIPTTSPWKSSSPNSTTTLPVEELRDKSRLSKSNNNGSGSIRLSSDTKWTPITPSVIISGSKEANSNSRRKAKSVKNNRKMKQHSSNNSNAIKRVCGDQPSTVAETNDDPNSEHKSTDADLRAKANLDQEVPIAGIGQKTENGKNTSNPRQQKNHHNKNSKTRYNKAAHHNNSFSNNHYQSRSDYIPNFGHDSGPGYNQQTHFHSQQYYNNYNYQQQLQTPYYNLMDPILKSIESIKNQIEYYFSAENLTNDKFLRSKFSKTNDGFIPMSLIGKFYRMVNLSLGGDPNLILASMREVLNNGETNHLEIAFGRTENAQVKPAYEFNPLDNYFIRPENWAEFTEENSNETDETEKYKIEKILEIGDLDNHSYMGYPSFYPSNVNEENSQTQDENTMNREFEQNLQINN
ncbi:hypothetical protein SEUBUCD646_0B06100 [Saccharomyces eubayanus]|uniref:HTH La-type RNA-binding domain-containing protein n=2 Tax=Saccharomyces TaxID=4930 RepID=A0A6C1E3E2_SACPS|nr:SLF1-like protein [Saccharomyces eubayanus]KOH01317.1 SLF1-like protein [Saccharomyces eubayanus]QID83818.1 hypothetical protein GRS66_006297 [Saccharomyces pastorianus]CAI1864227.1 hypothetical protein SEUBUCD650_0B06100 [Saccharomyces eubayanus]CAI1898703.1 hypothetical protein SEUBUCD646_0B06100 [Saccharomyces eubayanus]